MMGKSAKPRKAYKPRQVMTMPAAYGMTPDMAESLEARDRLAIAGAIAGRSEGELRAVEMIVVQSIYIAREAIRSPSRHEVCPEDLAEALRALEREIAPAVHGMTRRYTATGKLSCADGERDALHALSDIADQLRKVIPRRIVMTGYHQAMSRPVLALEVAG